MQRADIHLASLIALPVDLWNTKWFLLSAGDFQSGDYNCMTVSWGGLGTMWNKPLALVVVRPTRYTREFMERSAGFTLCAFPEEHRKKLSYCGSHTGREGNKAEAAGFTPMASRSVTAPSFEEAELVLECRKTYFSDLDPSHFLDPSIESHYPAKDYHRVYFGEILAAAGTSGLAVGKARPMSTLLPLKNPRPDSRHFLDVLMGRKKAVPPLVEYLVDDVVMKPIVENLLGRTWVPAGTGTSHEVHRSVPSRDSQKAYLDTFIEFWLRMGYDFVRFEQDMGFKESHLEIADTAPGSVKQRAWADQHTGAIASWEDFERYPWPKVEEFDFFPFEYVSSHLPEGMGMITCHGGGLYEHLSWIMSYEGLCMALYNAPDLVQAVADRIGGLLTGFYTHLLQLDGVIAIFQGDDMGFKTGTLLAPDMLRRYCLPWQKKFAAMAHASGRPYFLHSCGNLAAIMEDLIEDVRIDGKHSYENGIIPVQEFQKKYGDRIAVLGGLDINILTRSTPAGVRKEIGKLMDDCGPRGRYAVGSGNSVPSYIPVENYLAMVEEAVNRRGLS